MDEVRLAKKGPDITIRRNTFDGLLVLIVSLGLTRSGLKEREIHCMRVKS